MSHSVIIPSMKDTWFVLCTFLSDFVHFVVVDFNTSLNFCKGIFFRC